MPYYDLHCPEIHTLDDKSATGFTFEALVGIKEENPKCELCGGPTERVWAKTRHYGSDPAWPQVTQIFGKPMIVESAKEMARLGKERGWTLRDDATWLEEGDYLGAKWEYDPVQKKKRWVQKYSTATAPGSWKFDWSNHHELQG